METSQPTAKYKILPDADRAVRVQFFCDLSGALACTTEPIHADTPEQALEIAWKTAGKKEFNHCEKCGKWVSDTMYNPSVQECVKCAPWENYPLYCHQCGKKITEVTKLCPKCGALLQYEGG